MHIQSKLANRLGFGERTAWALAAVLLALLSALALLHFRHSNEILTPALSSLLPPTGLRFTFRGINVTSLAVSPDGKKVAFCAPDESGNTQLYIRFLDILEPRKLGGSMGATNPFWSPDSRFVAFFADGKLKKVDINGAPPLTVTTASAGRSGSWNSEGVIIFSPSATDPIHRVAATGGESTPVTKIDGSKGETTHRWAHFLPAL